MLTGTTLLGRPDILFALVTYCAAGFLRVAIEVVLFPVGRLSVG